MVDAWLSSPAIAMMLPEQEGAYVRLLALAWGDGSSEPKLLDDAQKLAQMSRLGSRWKKLGGLVREQFEERDGYLVNAKQLAVWQEAQEKHASAVERGKKGGETRAKKRRSSASSQASSSAIAEGVAEGVAGTQATKRLQSPVSEPYGSERQEQAADAPAPEGARTPPTGGDYLDRQSAREELAKRTHVTPRERSTEPVPTIHDAQREHEGRQAAYDAVFLPACAEFMGLYPEETKAIGRRLRAQMNLGRGELEERPAQRLLGAVQEEIRRRCGWPTVDSWDGSHEAFEIPAAEGVA